MAKNKTTTSKSPAAQKIKAGPKGGMHDFAGVGDQQPGVSNVAAKNAGKKFPTGGPSGKMQKFSGVKAQKPGQSAQQSSGSKSYAK